MAASTALSPTEAFALAEPGTGGPGLIAYQAIDGGHDTVLLMRADGSASRRVEGLPGSVQLHPDWSPDGTRLAFEAAGPKADDLWISKADGSGQRLIVERNKSCTSSTCGDAAYPAWSPDGTRIAFISYEFEGDTIRGSTLEFVEVASGTRIEVYSAPGDYLDYPRWSPDGTKIVFESTKGDNSASWVSVVAARKGQQATDLTPRDMFATYPDWQRTGDHLIVFSTYDLGGFQQTDEPSNLYTIRPDGSGMRRLTNFGPASTRATQPEWTPDGSRILFTLVGQAAGAFDLPRRAAFVDPDGTNILVLAPDATHPRLQPQP